MTTGMTEQASVDLGTAADSPQASGAPVVQTELRPKPAFGVDRMAKWVGIALTICLAAVFVRVVQLQIRPSEKLSAFISDRTVRQTELGVRADIRDARGRLLAASRFGQRVFVDPVNFPNPPGEAMAKLADALGTPVEDIAKRIVPKMSANADRLALLNDNDPTNDPTKGASQYVTISGVLQDWQVTAVKALRVPGVHLEPRAVRETPGSALAAELLGKVGIDHDGLLGVERMLDKAVRPTDGSMRMVMDAAQRPLWVEEAGYTAPRRGSDVELSIDLEYQRMATEELDRGLTDADAAGGRLIAMNPHTGEVIAMVDIVRDIKDAVDYTWQYPIGQEPGGKRPRYRTIKADPNRFKDPAVSRNRCVEDIYEPGSTFKPFMWSAVTALGLATPGEMFDTEDGVWKTPYGRPVRDVAARGEQTWKDVLVNSSNIGMTKGTARMSAQQMHDAVRSFGFGTPVGLGLAGESSGRVTALKDWSKYTQTSVAMGYEVAVTPLQMVRAFSAFAREGENAGTIPNATLLALQSEREPAALRRVLPPDVAELTRRTMTGVTEALERKVLKNEAKSFRYDTFGKSGTAQIPLPPRPKGVKPPRGNGGYFVGQYNVSFICGAPVESPRIVVLVVVDDPGPRLVRENRYYGAMVAGPVARRFVERALAYMGVEPTMNTEATPVLSSAD